jgi:3',5'-cyclic AMP phosphodiesterase CpdA
MRRIAHLSDLHCPPDRQVQAEQLIAAVVEAKPDIVVVTGDVTRAGRRHEFDSARRLLDRLPGVHLIVPGNHDVPLLNLATRVAAPFKRFHERVAVTQPAVFIDSEVAIVGLNTARGVQARLNWSRGVATLRAVRKALGLLVQAPQDAVRILVSHHPIVPDLRDPGRSKTRGASRALVLTSEHRVSILMHGHLHRARAEAIVNGAREVVVIGAGTALSNREREEPASFNLVEVVPGAVDVTEMSVNRQGYSPARAWRLKLPSSSEVAADAPQE